MSQSLLARAVRGEQEAFRELTDPYRRELQFHCYRILGSMQDAEDALQETLVSAWRGLAGFEERSPLRAWLYRIATNRCLDALRDAGRRPPPAPEPPYAPPAPTRMAEVTWLEPYPDALLEGIIDTTPGPEARYETRETIELAFIAALQASPPAPARRAATARRARLPRRRGRGHARLKRGLGQGRAQASTLDDRPTTSRADRDSRAPAAGLRRRTRARSTLRRRLGGRRHRLGRRAAHRRRVVQHAAVPARIPRATAIAAFCGDRLAGTAGAVARSSQPGPTTQPAFGRYRNDEHAPIAHAVGVLVLTIEGERISAITHFVDRSVPGHFGLPRTLRSRSHHQRR